MSHDSEYKIIRQAIYLIRSLHKKPSADRVIKCIRAIGTEAPHKSRVCAYMKQILGEEATKQIETAEAIDESL
jgi:hypothetical protein